MIVIYGLLLVVGLYLLLLLQVRGDVTRTGKGSIKYGPRVVDMDVLCCHVLVVLVVVCDAVAAVGVLCTVYWCVLCTVLCTGAVVVVTDLGGAGVSLTMGTQCGVVPLHTFDHRQSAASTLSRATT